MAGGMRSADGRGWRDLTMSARRLARRPAYTLCAVVLIGGAAGTLTVVGRLADAILFEGLPYAAGETLVAFRWAQPELGIPDMALSLVEARELPSLTSAVTGVATTLTPLNVTLLGPDGPVHLAAGLVTPESFEVLGLEPALGRRFHTEEGEPGAAPGAVVLDHGAWLRTFGGRPDVVGTDLVINGLTWTVAGVLPAGLTPAPERASPVDLWLPMGVAELLLGQDVFNQPTAHMFRVNARLAPGTTPDAFATELTRVTEDLVRAYPETNTGWELHAEPLQDRVVGRTRAPVIALLLGTLCLGVAAVLSLAGLLLQRSEVERLELAIRAALGATAMRIARQRAADAVVIGLLGGALAVALAQAGFVVLRVWDPLELPRHVGLALRWPEVASSLGLSLAMALGVTVAVRIAHARAPGVLPTTTAPPPRAHARRALTGLGLQVAMSASLTVGAIATARSLHALRAMDTGVDSERLLTARVEVPTDLLSPDEIARRVTLIVDALRDRPDVAEAFVWSPEIPSEARTYTALRLESMAVGGRDERILARYHSVTPGAASAVGMRIVSGRDLSEDDVAAGRRTALVSVSAARIWWGSEEAALGQRIQRLSHSSWSEVVGVVADAPISGRYGPGSENDLDVFFALQQDPRRTLVVFARAESGTLEQDGVRAAVASVVPELPLYDVRWLADRLRDQERIHASTAALTMLYALAALLLTAVGLAGSSLLWVARRRAEIGIRQAMGATRRRALAQILGGGLVTVGVGVAVGAALARLGLALVDPEVLTVGPTDLSSHLGMVLVVGCGATLALLVPALRSVRLTPMECLRTASRP